MQNKLIKTISSVLLLFLIIVTISSCVYRGDINFESNSKFSYDVSDLTTEVDEINQTTENNTIIEDTAVSSKYDDLFYDYDIFLKMQEDHFQEIKDSFKTASGKSLEALTHCYNIAQAYKFDVVPYLICDKQQEYLMISYDIAKQITDGMSVPDLYKLTGKAGYNFSMMMYNSWHIPELLIYNIEGYGHLFVYIKSDIIQTVEDYMYYQFGFGSVPVPELIEATKLEDVLTREEYYNYLDVVLSWKVDHVSFNKGTYFRCKADKTVPIIPGQPADYVSVDYYK